MMDTLETTITMVGTSAIAIQLVMDAQDHIALTALVAVIMPT
jgi:hypothetical protein